MRRDALQRILRGVRNRLLWVFVVWAVGAGLTWQFHPQIFAYLLAPAEGRLSPDGKPIFTNPTEMLNLLVKVSVKGGLVAAAPVLVYQAYGFLRPVLSTRAKHFIRWFLPSGFLCFMVGASFAYLVMIPTGVRYLLSFGTEIATPMISITAYMEMMTALIFWLGIVFELPLAMLLLAKLGIVDHKKFQRVRRYVPIAAVTLGVVITPTTDLVNMLFVAVPLILLYEVGIRLAWLARPRLRL